MEYIVLFSFLLEVVILVKLERQRWGTLLTPFCVLAITFTIVSLIAILYSHTSVYVKDFYIPSLFVGGVGLFFFYLPSTLFVKPSIRKSFAFLKTSYNDDQYKVMLFITMLFVAIGIYKVHSLSAQLDFGTDEFGDGFGSGGLLAHITMFLTGAFAYFLCKFDKKHWTSIFPIILIMIIMFAQASKTRTLTPLLTGGVALILSGKIKLSAKTLIGITFVGIAFFFIAYYLSLVATGLMTDMKDFWDFISIHFLDYFIGGTLSFSLDYQVGIIENENTMGLFQPFITLINKIFGFNIGSTFVNDLSFAS